MKIRIATYTHDFANISLSAENTAEFAQLREITKALESNNVDFHEWHDAFETGEQGVCIKTLLKNKKVS